MTKEIKRTSWSRFVKKFTSDNQYRQMTIRTTDKNSHSGLTMNDSAFFGLELEKRGRYIDGFKFYAGRYDPENIPYPVISFKQPETVKLETDDKGIDNRLTVLTKEGIEATITLTGERDEWRQREFVEKVAYSIYERRGQAHGNDRDDWLVAEALVRQAEEKFV